MKATTAHPLRSVADKMGIKKGWRAHVVDAPPGLMDSIGLPPLFVVDTWDGEFDYIHLFVTTRAAMREHFPALVPHVAPQGKLWVSWPKRGQLGSDLWLPTVIELGYDAGLVESTCLRIDNVWAGLRFTHPKPGRTYTNSYGTLPPDVDPGA